MGAAHKKSNSGRRLLMVDPKRRKIAAPPTGLQKRTSRNMKSKYAVYGKAALSWAAESGDVQEVQQQLETEEGFELLDTKTTGYPGRTALMWAAIKGHVEVLRMLLSAGASATVTDQFGWTALHYACHHGQEEAALLLLDHAAVCSSGMEGLAKLRDCWGCTALMVAAEEGQVSVLRRVKDRLAGEGKDGDTVDVRDMGGRTALAWACREGKVEAVKELLAGTHPADPGIADQEGRLPGELALAYRHKNCADTLKRCVRSLDDETLKAFPHDVAGREEGGSEADDEAGEGEGEDESDREKRPVTCRKPLVKKEVAVHGASDGQAAHFTFGQ